MDPVFVTVRSPPDTVRSFTAVIFPLSAKIALTTPAEFAMETPSASTPRIFSIAAFLPDTIVREPVSEASPSVPEIVNPFTPPDVSTLTPVASTALIVSIVAT
ncbi:MAG: hypothetical protein LMBGKNDO_01618 [Bacteroidales bacterium]|nr:hypothetical protein [Bacteroidales bacterium]